MVEIKMKSKQGINFRERLLQSNDVQLQDVYKNWSNRKEVAYKYCINEFEKDNGYKFRIISYNTFGFTVAWFLPNGNIRVETPQTSYIVINN